MNVSSNMYDMHHIREFFLLWWLDGFNIKIYSKMKLCPYCMEHLIYMRYFPIWIYRYTPRALVYIYLLKGIIIKPPESGELCEEITEFAVVEGDRLPPQTKWSPHTAHQMKVVVFLYLIKEMPMVSQKPKECCIVFIMN